MLQIFRALCDEENQPHQWLGDPGGLETAFAHAVSREFLGLGTAILIAEGKPEECDFDKSYHTDDHDVPALWLGDQIVAIGDGYRPVGFGHVEEDAEHLRWKLDPNKTYRVTIEEIEPDWEED